MSKSVDVILSAVKSAGEAAIRLHEENASLRRELAEAQRVVTAAARVRQFISVAGNGRCEPGWIGAICGLYSAEFIYRTEYQQAAADQPSPG